MASTNKVFVSPGVYTSERDLTFVAQSVGVTTLGLVGETLQGPAFEPIFITNFDEYQAYFGGTSPERFVNTQIPKYETSYIAKSYLSQSNQLFVTRVLGLSGYDAGPSWSITTIGNPDPSTVNVTGVTTLLTLTFTGTTGVSTNLIVTSIPSLLSPSFYNSYTTFNGGTSSLNLDIQSFLSTEVNNYALYGSGSTGGNALFWGVVSSSTYNSVTGVTAYGSQSITATTNVLGVDNLLLQNSTLSDPLNDPWYYALFDYSKISSEGSYAGYGFGLALDSISTGNTTTEYTGTCSVYATLYSGTPYSDYDDLVVATLRSRGITTYSSTQDGPRYEVSATTGSTMVCTGSYSAVTKDPFATFVITGQTYDNDTFSFETSMDSTETNYISRVFGRSNFGKDRTEVPLFVEEAYSNLLFTGYKLGKVRGLYCDFIQLDRANSNDTESIGFYLEQYQTPETPFVVSELRCNKVYKLFKFILISDGNAANRLVKMSIANISFNNGTFDVVVRDYYDTDRNPVILERFNNCSMDPSLNNYVANKIGTSNGEYQVKSKYVMLELSNEAPVDALPCGFDGYVTREYSEATSPFVIYKTKYWTAGEVIYNPPFGSVNGGDNSDIVNQAENPRFAYLGISNITGVDYDFFDYKGRVKPNNIATDTTGRQWGNVTKGFHMDVNASGITVSGVSVFDVGISPFNFEPDEDTNAYYRLNTRKFTLYPYGGFDGWDIYRE